MRGLSTEFINALKGGILSPILEAIKRDNNLILEIRNNYIDIYYRGGLLLGLKQGDGGYKADFNSNYVKDSRQRELFSCLPSIETMIKTEEEAVSWVENFHKIKAIMDYHFTENKKLEREFQQLVVRENNILREANNTDYYVVDFEYQDGDSRFDLIALRWDSTSQDRKNPDKCRLAIIEMKYGDSSLKENSGLVEHIKDVEEFLSDPGRVDEFKKEMLNVFDQKRKLGLISFSKGGNDNIVSSIKDKTEFIVLLAGHKPASSILETEISGIVEMQNADLKFATASFMGYGLYNSSMLSLDEFKKTLKKQ